MALLIAVMLSLTWLSMVTELNHVPGVGEYLFGKGVYHQNRGLDGELLVCGDLEGRPLSWVVVLFPRWVGFDCKSRK